MVIVSDHGMDGYGGKTKQKIMEGLDDVGDLEKGVEWGSYMSLQVAEESGARFNKLKKMIVMNIQSGPVNRAVMGPAKN